MAQRISATPTRLVLAAATTLSNGIYLGMNCKLAHAKGYTDVMPGFEVGYAYFLSRTVTLEPAIYYDQSFKSHSDYSTVGFKVGIGVYLFND